MMADEILNRILEDGKVDAEEVSALEAMVNGDWVVDRDEVELLFRVNHAIGNKDEECPQWSKFFVATVTRLVVNDLDTPGEISEDEGNWLGEVLEANRVQNDSEKKLIFEIQNTTTKILGKLADSMAPFE